MTFLEQIFFGIVSFLIFLLVHVLVWQNKRIKYRGVYLIWKIVAINYIITTSLVILIYSVSVKEHFWVSGPLYFCLAMIYTHLYVGIDKSVSIRIMGELVTSSNNTLLWVDLDNIYSPYWMVKTRLDLLVEKNWLEIKIGKYLILPKAKILFRAPTNSLMLDLTSEARNSKTSSPKL